MEQAEVFGVEGEAVAGEDVFDGDIVDWIGHFMFSFLVEMRCGGLGRSRGFSGIERGW